MTFTSSPSWSSYSVLRRLLKVCFFVWVVSSVEAQNPSESGADPGQPPLTVVGGDYVLRANDVISVTVFGEPELNRQDRLVSDGTIMMPLIGRIKVAGQTSVQAAESIRRALAADYLVNPQVSVSITEAVQETFTVLGQVASPGAYPLPAGGRISLLQAIGSAGGFTRLASPGRITVKRQENGKEMVYKVDGKSQAKSEQVVRFEVRAGDVITVPESFF
ncbi:polysaccharide export outer membrane protein [Prosthecobacter fusiformis]|uniref:Polysaccharide export outer membrane protein n=1 Tax=Prosthecobacter fusiformis TaxID=48464 RepID=A0A4R7S2X8_9BACT|nr:polysaccharide biosynthesis/export family protein [Prosthecobacter fusiformis]TDU71377.1 polysaccharide export outer membrane protein [Prosthecobacter fusiformis]